MRTSIAAVAAAAATATVAAAPAHALVLGPAPGTTQTVEVAYSGFSCPTSPVVAVSATDVRLVLDTTTNFTPGVFLVIPSRNVRIPVPVAFGTVQTATNIGPLPAGLVPFQIDAPPALGSYGASCRGAFWVTPW
jgi:hypothetical protein